MDMYIYTTVCMTPMTFCKEVVCSGFLKSFTNWYVAFLPGKYCCISCKIVTQDCLRPKGCLQCGFKNAHRMSTGV